LTNPIFAYEHDQPNCNSITGGAFVPDGLWAGYDGAYFYADFICDKIFTLTPDGGGGWINAEFSTTAGSPVTLIFGPHNATQALYYTAFNNGGEVRRIVFTGP
jgi:hypothetical protein